MTHTNSDLGSLAQEVRQGTLAPRDYVGVRRSTSQDQYEKWLLDRLLERKEKAAEAGCRLLLVTDELPCFRFSHLITLSDVFIEYELKPTINPPHEFNRIHPTSVRYFVTYNLKEELFGFEEDAARDRATSWLPNEGTIPAETKDMLMKRYSESAYTKTTSHPPRKHPSQTYVNHKWKVPLSRM